MNSVKIFFRIPVKWQEKAWRLCVRRERERAKPGRGWESWRVGDRQTRKTNFYTLSLTLAFSHRALGLFFASSSLSWNLTHRHTVSLRCEFQNQDSLSLASFTTNIASLERELSFQQFSLHFLSLSYLS